MTGPGAAEPAAPAENEKVSFLDQALWRQLKDAASAEAYAEAWLGLLCRTIDGAARGMVLLGEADTGPFRIAAVWPVGETGLAPLSQAADAVVAERRGIVQGDTSGAEGGIGEGARIAYPFLVDGRLYGVVVLQVAGTPGPQLRETMRRVQWGTAWMESLLRRQIGARDNAALTRTKAALDFLAAALEEERFLTACTAVVTALATRLDCERVSIGFVRRGTVAVATISHSARFGRRMKLIRQIGAAMDEALDQRTAILYPDDAENEQSLVATLAHRDLAQGDGGDAVLTLPLTVGDEMFGALMLERPADRPFDGTTMEIADSVAVALGPVLNEKRLNDRWLLVKVADSISGQLTRLLGPAHVGRKLILAAALGVFAFLYFATGAYRVTAPAEIEGLQRRVVVASFDGYIASAHLRAGDRVQAGDMLATLDDKDLVLERLQWVTERQEKLKEYDRALAEADRARANIAKVQIEAADARIALIDEQLSRAKLVAPFDGLIVAGDLSQSIGGAVERGDVLFEVTPLDAYRVILQVDESEIAYVTPGQLGALRVTSLPDTLFPFRVEKVTPVAEAEEGRNYFRVEAILDGPSHRLLPGMEGIGKIEIGERRLVWIWTRTLIERVGLWLWYWRP